MNCPADQSELRETHEDDSEIELDHCDRCGGVWFDADELKKAAAYYSTELPSKTGKEMFAPGDTHKWKPPTDYDCPNDGEHMDEYQYAGDSEIYIHHCPKCGGFWFDRGELDKLKEYLRPAPDLDAMGRSIIDEDNDYQHLLNDIAAIPAELKVNSVPFLLGLIGKFFLNWYSIEKTEKNNDSRFFQENTL